MSEKSVTEKRSQTGDVTKELRAFTDGEQDALDRVMGLVYAQLRRIAHKALSDIRVGNENLTLETGDLFNEAYLKLRNLTPQNLSFDHRGGFFRYCIRIMQCHLREHAEKKRAMKRGGDVHQISLDDFVYPDSLKTLAEIIPDKQSLSFADILALEELLDQHRTQFPRQADVLAHKIYLGMKNEDIAHVLGVSTATVNRDIYAAHDWLKHHWNSAGRPGSAASSSRKKDRPT